MSLQLADLSAQPPHAQIVAAHPTYIELDLELADGGVDGIGWCMNIPPGEGGKEPNGDRACEMTVYY